MAGGKQHNKASIFKEDVENYNEREPFIEDSDMDALLRERLLRERKKRDAGGTEDNDDKPSKPSR